MSDLNPLNWNWNQYKAAGRHVASYAAGGITVAVGLHFITPQQAVDANGNLTQITTGLTQLIAGITGLVTLLAPIYTSFKAAHSASPVQEAAALSQAMPGTQIVTAPEVANAPANISNPNIVSTTEAKVVTK